VSHEAVSADTLPIGYRPGVKSWHYLGLSAVGSAEVRHGMCPPVACFFIEDCTVLLHEIGSVV